MRRSLVICSTLITAFILTIVALLRVGQAWFPLPEAGALIDGASHVAARGTAQSWLANSGSAVDPY
jgi:hypothetical protein